MFTSLVLQYGRAANTMNVKEKEAFSYLNDGVG